MTYRRLLAFCFMLNGVCLLANKAISEFGLSKSAMYILVWLYGVGAVMNLVHVLMNRKPVSRQNITIGLMGGLSSVTGMVTSVLAISMIPAYIAFPLINGGTLLIVALAGLLFFKEKIGPYGIAGIISGIAAIALLSMK